MRYTIKRKRVSSKRVSSRNKNHQTRLHNRHKRKRNLRGGDKIEGTVKNCLLGKDKCYFIYDGELNPSGYFHGKGKVDSYYATADDKKGEWIDTYEGSFKNGVEHGEGISTRTNRIFIGTWVNGKREGKGTIMLNPAFLHRGIDNYRIDGIWKNDDLISGKYTKDFHDGTRTIYDGGINNDKEYHGVGKCSWYDVDHRLVKEYDGTWRNHKMHGQGKMTTYRNDGTIDTTVEGIWANNVFSPLQTDTSKTSKMIPSRSSTISLLPPPPTSKLSSLSRQPLIMNDFDD